MLSQVITHINQIIEGMPFFRTVYGLSELKTDNGVTQPVTYVSGNWERIKLANFGFTYWRKRGNVTFTESTNNFISCNTEYVSTIPMRLFAITKRSAFPLDDAYSAERLAGALIKSITLTGGDLKRQLQARQLNVRARLYSTNTEEIIKSEFAGVKPTDFNYNDLVIAIDVDIIITMAAPCYEDPCDYVPRFCLQLESYVALP